MKLSALSGVVRKKNSVQVMTCEATGGEMVIGANCAALYRCGPVPNVYGPAQIGALLSLTKKQLDKVVIREEQYETLENIHGLDLSENGTPTEQDTTETAMQFTYKHKSYTSLRTKDGEILFFESLYLAPLAEEMQSAYFSLKTRLLDDGHRHFNYIIAKDGLTTLAAIMPYTVLSEEFIKELDDMNTDCANQFRIEEARRENCR